MHKSQMFVTFLDDEEYEEEKQFFWLTSVFVTEKNFVLFILIEAVKQLDY